MPVPSISLVPFAGRPRSLIGTPGKPTLDDVGDAVVLHHDVHRAARRRAGAVDHGDAANHQAIERAFAFAGLPVRRRLHLLGGQGERGHQADGQSTSRIAARRVATCFASERSEVYQRPEVASASYSVRSAVIGSTRMARRAGTKLASAAAAIIAVSASPQAIGSNGVMP